MFESTALAFASKNNTMHLVFQLPRIEERNANVLTRFPLVTFRQVNKNAGASFYEEFSKLLCVISSLFADKKRSFRRNKMTAMNKNRSFWKIDHKTRQIVLGVSRLFLFISTALCSKPEGFFLSIHDFLVIYRSSTTWNRKV